MNEELNNKTEEELDRTKTIEEILAETGTTEEDIEKNSKVELYINSEKIEQEEIKTDVVEEEKSNEQGSVEDTLSKENDIKEDETSQTIEGLGLHGIKETFEEDLEISRTKFYRGSIRCGVRMEFEDSIVIIGDVNAGSEVIAGGNIVVTGFLKGLAHAGAKGNKKATITARGIENPQIRIADIVKELHNLPEFTQNKDKKQDYAYVKDGQIIIE